MRTELVRAAAPVAAGAALGAVLTGVARVAGYSYPWQVTVPAGLVAGVLIACARLLPEADPVVTAAERRGSPPASASFGDLGALRIVVEMDSRDPDRFETRLRPRLTALAAERLWQRHRLDWRTDDGRAAALPLLGPDLVELLTAPPRTLRPSPATLNRWTRALEEL